MDTIFHDTDTGFFPSVDEVRARFMQSAADVHNDFGDDDTPPLDFAASIFSDALAGDLAARDLIEATCGVEFL